MRVSLYSCDLNFRPIGQLSPLIKHQDNIVKTRRIAKILTFSELVTTLCKMEDNVNKHRIDNNRKTANNFITGKIMHT